MWCGSHVNLVVPRWSGKDRGLTWCLPAWNIHVSQSSLYCYSRTQYPTLPGILLYCSRPSPKGYFSNFFWIFPIWLFLLFLQEFRCKSWYWGYVNFCFACVIAIYSTWMLYIYKHFWVLFDHCCMLPLSGQAI